MGTLSAWLLCSGQTSLTNGLPTCAFSAQLGNFGEYRVLEEGVCELKIDFGPGYRVYYVRRGEVVYLLLCGGDKSTQKKDIKRAVQMARELKE